MWKNNLFISIVVLVLVLHNASIDCFFASSWTESGDVIVLTNDNFKSTTTQHDVLLVMFYVKWCSHCRRLYPDYEQAATKLAKNTESPMYIAKLDCSNNKEAQCSTRYRIDGFPTMRIYRYGRFIGEELNSLNRTSNEIAKTMIALKTASGQQKQTEFASGQMDGVNDDVNKATARVQCMWLLIGLLYGLLQQYVV